MSKYIYEVEANLGKVLPSVGEALDSVNKIMEDFGFKDGKLIARSVIATGLIGINRSLSASELAQLRNVIEECFNKAHPDWETSISILTPGEL